MASIISIFASKYLKCFINNFDDNSMKLSILKGMLTLDNIGLEILEEFNDKNLT